MQVFDGVHVDVEPWARTDWDTRRAEVVAGYVDVLRRLAATCPLRLEADVAFWLHEVRTSSGTPLDQAVLRLVDAVTVLSFRNVATGPDSIIDVARTSLAAADRLGIPCSLAVETNDLGPDPTAQADVLRARSRCHGRGTRGGRRRGGTRAGVRRDGGARPGRLGALEAGSVTEPGAGEA